MEWVILGRAALAMLLVALLGWEREYRARPAGLRTHMLVGLSSALFAGLGELYLEHHPQLQTDPLRVLQAVVTGVSFLGAGTVFVSRDHGVQGLTTAATLWTASAVGVACGLGEALLGAGVTGLALVVLIAARWIELKTSKKAQDHPPARPILRVGRAQNCLAGGAKTRHAGARVQSSAARLSSRARVSPLGIERSANRMRSTPSSR